jgi:hypothetical protein
MFTSKREEARFLANFIPCMLRLHHIFADRFLLFFLFSFFVLLILYLLRKIWNLDLDTALIDLANRVLLHSKITNWQDLTINDIVDEAYLASHVCVFVCVCV